MKQRIFMYLFIFTVLLVVFQYANSKSILDTYEADITKLKAKVESQNKEISDLKTQNEACSGFTINGNEAAISYLEDKGFNAEKLLQQLKDGLYEMNNYQGTDHPIVPYVSMTNNRMVIDQIQVLNHKWILTNYTDGKHSGELFIIYSIDENNNLKYELKEYFMYPITP